MKKSDHRVKGLDASNSGSSSFESKPFGKKPSAEA
jgi:hypothetical protein